jgi:hypothetical protein
VFAPKEISLVRATALKLGGFGSGYDSRLRKKHRSRTGRQGDGETRGQGDAETGDEVFLRTDPMMAPRPPVSPSPIPYNYDNTTCA